MAGDPPLGIEEGPGRVTPDVQAPERGCVLTGVKWTRRCSDE
ncbi:hypothetical protein ACEE90_12335 [Corynebacterium phoceense]|nr:hypothetical protein [Corynebacterium phoceense]MCQ9332592.1 hypothetical protein [Corynebacterium phoceense]MCQ9336223.1 hypothetical protein [Corynebacterium phoceense]